MADQNLLDAINIGKKNLLDTISIDKPLDISLIGITQNYTCEDYTRNACPNKRNRKELKN